MRQFFKFFFASFLAILVFVFILISIIGIASSVFSNKEVLKDGVLLLDFSENISEKHLKFDVSNVLNSNESSNTFYNYIQMINKAKNDNKIKGIYILEPNDNMSTAQIQELRRVLLDFKKSNKFIIAYSKFYSKISYYLSSVADEMYINPQGNLEFLGLSSNVAYLKKSFDALGIEMQLIRGKDNDFKSAGEPYIIESMSESNRKQITELLDDIWSDFIDNASKKTGKNNNELNLLSDNYGVMSAKEALQNKFVDGIKYRDEVDNIVLKRSKLTINKNSDIDEFLIKSSKYNNLTKDNYSFENDPSSKIGLLIAEGDIVSIGDDNNSIVSSTMIQQIRKLKNDPNYKAVVLRINSPGGDAIASDEILRELNLLKKVKPLIISMGNLAASGGYYIACNGNRIFAEKNTITGSIGVFGLIPNNQKLIEEKLKVKMETVKTNEMSDFYLTFRSLTDKEKTRVQQSVDEIYSEFKDIVSNGRKLKREIVDTIAKGRVWTGKEALKLGLVDEIGGLNNAINYAKKLINNTNAMVEELLPEETEMELLLKNFADVKYNIKTIDDKNNMMFELLKKEYFKTKKYLNHTPQNNIQMRIPFDIYIN